MVILDENTQQKQLIRLKYMPYSIKVAKQTWFKIASSFIDKKIVIGEQLAIVWDNLIKYSHGDDSCKYPLEKSICLMGRTGSSKTISMKILREYLKIDDVQCIRKGLKISFNFAIHNAKDIRNSYLNHGFSGIEKYLRIGNLCIDDLGSEGEDANYYGTKLNVIAEVFETRYNRGLITHFTTNYKENIILERYGRRVLSRMEHACKFVELNDQDYRAL